MNEKPRESELARLDRLHSMLGGGRETFAAILGEEAKKRAQSGGGKK